MPLSDWLNIDLTDGHTTLLPVVMLALTTGAAAIKIGRRQRRGGTGRRAALSTAAARAQAIRPSLPAGLLDIETELRAIVRNLEELAVQRRVVIELATQPHLTVRSDRTLFCDTMNGLLMHAIGQSGGKVLLGAFRDDWHIQVIVADDGRVADPSAQPVTLRLTERLAAQQGATLEIDPKDGEGTTIILRMAATEAVAGPPVSDAARVCG